MVVELAEPKPAAALFYGFSRQCSRRPFLPAKGPPIWAIRVHRAPLSSTSVVAAAQPRPHRPGRYFIPALKRAPAEISFRNSLRSRALCRGPVVSPRGISRHRAAPPPRCAPLARSFPPPWPPRLFIAKLARFIATTKRVLASVLEPVNTHLCVARLF